VIPARLRILCRSAFFAPILISASASASARKCFYTASAKADFRSALPLTSLNDPTDIQRAVIAPIKALLGGTHDEAGAALAATGALRYCFTDEGGAILAQL
jgi:hypothetical protein